MTPEALAEAVKRLPPRPSDLHRHFTARLSTNPLNPREQLVVVHRFGVRGADTLAYHVIGPLLTPPVSRYQVATIEKSALLKLGIRVDRAPCQSEIVNVYVAGHVFPLVEVTRALGAVFAGEGPPPTELPVVNDAADVCDYI